MMPRFRFFRQATLCLFVGTTLAITGCDPANMGAFRGVAEKVGAKVVSKASDEDIREMFRKTNDQCPVKMDVYTTLERVTMVDEKNVEFLYKVNDKGRKLVKGISKERMRENAVQHMKGNAMAVAVAERDLTIRHIYEDRFGGHVLSYVINKAVLEGREPIGDEQANPFSVKTVKAEAAKNVTEPAVEAETTETESVEVEESASQPVSEPVSQPVSEPLPMPEPEPEPEDLLAEPYQPVKRSRDNPAGVQSNPFFD